ncbi:MAG TPA: mechanosensitive ion channel family protein [Candidatus Bathyarchaeota archaeon]|nr:mechanosensitive ion channel family protein [Candidatus Bathyarchaeota archaeon]
MIANVDVAVVYRIVVVLVVAVATIIIGKLAEKLFKGGARKAGVPEVEASLVASLLKYLIYFVGIIEILAYVGFSSIPILFAITLIGIVVGISARSVLENVISGYILRMRKPFNIGERVKIGNKIGVIKDLDLIYTTIETDIHQHYTIPNAEITNSKIFNLTRSKYNFPIELKFTIPFRLSISKTKKLILETLKEYRGINPNLPITLSANDITATGVDLKVRFYVSEYEMIDEAKDLLIREISKVMKNGFESSTAKEKQVKDEANTETHAGKTETGNPIKCPMCDSKRWTGYLRCKKTSNYYLYGKCLNCDHLRLDKCPVDGSELEFIPSQKAVKGG